MQTVKRNPSESELCSFGWAMLGGFTVLGLLLWFLGLDREPLWRPVSGWGWQGGGKQITSVVFWVLGLTFWVVATTAPGPGRRLYVVWMTGAMYLGAVMTTILLSLMFFLFLPFLALIRFKDPLRLKLRGSGSYWEEHTPHEATLERSTRQF